MLDICRKLFDRWNAEVIYCHWKGNETCHLEKGLNGESDMDVLLSVDDKEIGHEILISLHFIQCKSQFGSRFPNVEDWIGFDQVTGNLVHLHLHFELVTGHDGLKEFNLPWRKEALDTRIFDKNAGIYVMNPNLELVTLYSRICLKSKTKHVIKALLNQYNQKFGFKKDPSEEIDYLKAQVNWDEIDKILLNYYPSHNCLTLKSILQKPEIDSSSFLSLFVINWKTMRKQSRYTYFALFFLIPFYTFLLRIIGWMKSHKCNYLLFRKVVKNGVGMSIAFLGQDGSGKSTVTNDIVNWLSWKLDTRIFYFGSGDQFRPWEKIFKSKLTGSSFVESILCRILSVLIYVRWSRYVTIQMKKSSHYIGKGGIGIYDRYPQIQYYGINDGPKIRINVYNRINSRILKLVIELLCKWEENSIKRATLKQPDIVIKLLLSPEESIRRKPFEKYENVKQKHEIIKNLKFEKSSVYEIDATQDYQEELLTIKKIIWKHLLSL